MATKKKGGPDFFPKNKPLKRRKGRTRKFSKSGGGTRGGHR
jgi:hypothetical protein